VRLLGVTPQCYATFYIYARNDPYTTYSKLVKDIEETLKVKIFPPDDLRIVFLGVPFGYLHEFKFGEGTTLLTRLYSYQRVRGVERPLFTKYFMLHPISLKFQSFKK